MGAEICHSKHLINKLQNSGTKATRLIGKQVLYGLTNVTTDANGAGWVPFNPNFKDTNVFFLIGLTDNNMVDRVETYKMSNNGVSVKLYKDSTIVANSNGWLNRIAIGNPI